MIERRSETRCPNCKSKFIFSDGNGMLICCQCPNKFFAKRETDKDIPKFSEIQREFNG